MKCIPEFTSFLLLSFLVPGSAAAASEVSPANAIEILRLKEATVECIRFQASETWYDGSTSQGKFEVALESSGRFRLHSSSLMPSLLGEKDAPIAGPDIGITHLFTYDGEIVREQAKEVESRHATDEDPATGLVFPESNVPFTSRGTTASAISYFYPYFFPLTREPGLHHLSSYLQFKLDFGHLVQVNENNENDWEITTVSSELTNADGSKTNIYMHILYAPDLGAAGCIKRVQLSLSADFQKVASDASLVVDEIDYRLVEVNGFYVPDRVRFFEGGGKLNDDLQVSYEYSDISINTPLKAEEFIIDWEKGTRIDDSILQQVYIASGKPIDEEKAIERFMVQHKLKKPNHGGGVVEKQEKGNRPLILAVNVVVILILAVLYFLKISKKGTTASVLLLSCVLATQGAAQTPHSPSSASRFQFDEGWWITSGTKKEARITQCSFYATAFVLKSFGVDYGSNLLAASLSPTEQGVSLRVMRDVLTGHGLRATGRKNVSLDELDEIDNGTMAILAVPVNAHSDHYYVIGRREDGAYVADVPKSVSSLNEFSSTARTKFKEAIDSRGGVVLFVQREKDRSALSSRLVVTPKSLSLGEFFADTAAPDTSFKKEIALENVSDKPVFVSLQTSCTCLGKLSWYGGLIQPGATQAVKFTIRAVDWGKGAKKAQIFLAHPDGTHSSVTIEGTRHSGLGTESLGLASGESVAFNLNGSLPTEFRDSMQAKLITNSELLDIVSSNSWLTVEATDAPDSKEKVRYLVFSVVGNEDLQNEFCESGSELNTSVTISDKAGNRIQVPVTLKRKSRASASADSVVISDDGGHLMISAEGFQIERVELDAQPPGLAHEIKMQKDGDCRVSLSSTSSSSHGHYLVKCKVWFTNGDCDLVRFVASRKR